MRYVMKQKWLSFGDDFRILDAHGVDAFYVDGKVFSIGNKLSFQDSVGKELAFIRQRLLTLGKTYEIERDGRIVATVHKHMFTLLRCVFTVDQPGPDDLEAAGNLLEHEYEFRRGSQTVATVSKRWFTLTDTYGVDVSAGQDPVLILCAAVVIDLCCHGDRKD